MAARPPESRTIPRLLLEQAQRHAQREALVAGEVRLSYAQLREQVLHVARGLAALGVRPGDHVAILMGNRPEWLLSFLALQQLGAVAIGLNTWATPRELAYALSHAEVRFLISVDRFKRSDYRSALRAMARGSEALPMLAGTVWLAADEAAPPVLEAEAGELAWADMLGRGASVPLAQVEEAGAAVDPDDVGMLLYTSGSTSLPKAILLQHGGWISNAFEIGERQKVTADDRLWLAVSLFWSFGSINALPNLLTHGGCVVLQESFDAAQALALIERERCSIIYATPNMLLALSEHPDRGRHDLSSLRSGATIGTPEQVALAVELGAREICNVYGLSETYGNCAVIDAAEPLELRLRSVGAPLPGVTVRICDLQTGATLAQSDRPGGAGQAGEIRVRGPLFKCYYKDPEKTAEAYDADGYFRTGDIGELDAQGRLYYKGRVKEMVKSGGINIAPAEVEETLMRHPGVRTAYVIGVPHPTLDEALVAIVIREQGADIDADALVAHCRRELAAYKVPQRFHFTTEDRLPLTTTGKVQKMNLHTLLD